MQYIEIISTLQNLTGNKPKQRDIAEILGVRTTVIGQRASRHSEFSIEDVKKIGEYYNVDLFHNGIQNVISVPNNEFVADYFPDVFGSCGNGTFILSEAKEAISIPKTIVNSYNPIKKYYVINAYGESMMPYINDRDLLVVEHFEFGEQIRDNRIYVFCYNDQIFVKRLIKNVDELIIKSDNPDPMYRARIIEKEDMNNVFIIGQIVGLMRKID